LAVVGSARLEEALLRGVPIERLDLEGGLEAGVLRIRSLDAVSGPNHVAVREAVVPLEPVRARDAAAILRVASGSYSARLGDVPALFALAGRPLPIADKPPPHHLELEGTVGGGVVAITVGRLGLARGGVRVESLRAVVPPAGVPWSSARFDAGLDVDLPDIALLNRVPLPALRDRSRPASSPAAPRTP
jgi:hypothetical protein